MRVVSLLAFKGGTGKTTVSLNLASAWSAKRTVALIDLDPQGNATHSLAPLTTPGQYTAAEALRESLDNPRFTLPPEAWSTVNFGDGSGFYLLPTPNADDLSATAERLAAKPTGEWALRRALDGVRGLDAVVIDTAPSISRLTWNAACASTTAFGVVTASRWSVEGAAAAEAFVRDAKEFGVSDAEWGGTIVNRVAGRSTTVAAAAKRAMKSSGVATLENAIPQRVAMEEAEFVGIPVLIGAPKSAAGKAMADVAKEVWRGSAPAGQSKKKRKQGVA